MTLSANRYYIKTMLFTIPQIMMVLLSVATALNTRQGRGAWDFTQTNSICHSNPGCYLGWSFLLFVLICFLAPSSLGVFFALFRFSIARLRVLAFLRGSICLLYLISFAILSFVLASPFSIFFSLSSVSISSLNFGCLSVFQSAGYAFTRQAVLARRVFVKTFRRRWLPFLAFGTLLLDFRHNKSTFGPLLNLSVTQSKRAKGAKLTIAHRHILSKYLTLGDPYIIAHLS